MLTAAPSVEGRRIEEYRGVVFGEVISGVYIVRAIGAGLRSIFG